MNVNEQSLRMHEENRGKIEVCSKVPVKNKKDLSLAYTPGVAEPCRKIHQDRENVYKYTGKGNLVAVVSDGTAVLGLGDIGPEAAMPVMEGKAVLFKEFGGVDAFPVCLATKDVDEIVKTVKNIAPCFGGINLEDISAPRCFEIENRLKEELDIPVFHDDQHGTAIVVLSGVLNALKLVGKKIENINAVVNGAGSAGVAISKLLLRVGIGNIVLCDKEGAITKHSENLTWAQKEMAQVTNKYNEEGSLKEVIAGKDLFIGVSAKNLINADDIRKMNKDAIVFALANPDPEIMPDEAKAGGAAVVCTGRSDYPNQVNNVLVFPGIFKGALKARAKGITEDMKIAAANAIASLISDDELSNDYVIPDPFDKRVANVVSEAVQKCVFDTEAAGHV